MSVAFVANLQASKRVKPSNRALDWPTRFAEVTSVGRTDFCEHRRDAAVFQTLSMEFRAVAPVALNDLRSMQGASPLATNVRNSLDQLSTSARDKSIPPRRRNSASSVSWIRCQTPACCHATSRRQQAVPEPQPISCGSRFHTMPERSTNTMPVSTARSGAGLRPAYCRLRGARAGKSGSMSNHNSSSMSSLGIASCRAKQDRKLTPSRKS